MPAGSSRSCRTPTPTCSMPRSRRSASRSTSAWSRATSARTSRRSGHWETFFRRTGAERARHVHVAASLFHDIEPCAKLGLPGRVDRPARRDEHGAAVGDASRPLGSSRDARTPRARVDRSPGFARHRPHRAGSVCRSRLASWTRDRAVASGEDLYALLGVPRRRVRRRDPPRVSLAGAQAPSRCESRQRRWPTGSVASRPPTRCSATSATAQPTIGRCGSSSWRASVRRGRVRWRRTSPLGRPGAVSSRGRHASANPADHAPHRGRRTPRAARARRRMAPRLGAHARRGRRRRARRDRGGGAHGGLGERR